MGPLGSGAPVQFLLRAVSLRVKRSERKSDPSPLFSSEATIHLMLGYGLGDRGSRVRFPVGSGNFSLYHRVQNGSGAHPATHSMGARSSFPGVAEGQLYLLPLRPHMPSWHAALF
jgi:hypothetical protein